MIKKIFAITFTSLFGIALLFLVGIWIGIDEIIFSFRAFTLPILLLYLLVSILIFIGHVWRWWLILRIDGFHIPFFHVARYRLEGYSVCYLTPVAFMGGEPLRAYLLKSKHDVPYTRGFSSIVIDKNFELIINGFFALIGVFLLLLNFALPKKFEILIAGAVIFSLVSVLFFYRELLYGRNIFLRIFRFLRLHKLKKMLKLEQKVIETEKQIHDFFIEHTRACKYILFSMILMWFLVYLEYHFALQLIGVEPSLMLIFLVFAMVGVSFIVPIPGGLGVLESTQASVFSLYGSTAASGVALSLLVRARDLVWVFLGLCDGGVHGIKQFYSFIVGKEDLKKE